MPVKAKQEQTQFDKLLKAYHKLSERHVLVLETDLPYQEKCIIFHYADLERKAGNELVGKMKPRYEQMVRTKKYRKLKKLYGKHANQKDAKARKEIAKQMSEMQKQYQVTWEFCRTSMIPIGKKYGLNSVTALTKAEDIWKAIEKCLYSDGRTIHFSKRGDLPNVRAKQRDRGIVLQSQGEALQVKFHGISFGVKIKDRFEREEVEAVQTYLSNPIEMDLKAVHELQENGVCISTYRPCYATLVCKKIRGKLRVYVHITIEGVAMPKYDRYGKKKHILGKSIKNRCPGGFQAQAERKFKSTNGIYIEVPLKYRASQYDHTADDYRKKKLSQRMYPLEDGTLVQRDWYSSYLMYSIDLMNLTIDREKCKQEFETHYEKEKKLIETI